MNIQFRAVSCLLLSAVILSSFGVQSSANSQKSNTKPQQKPKVVKTIRPLASIHYVNYEEMKVQSDAIFIGEAEDSLQDSKGTIVYLADKIHFSDYYTIREVKVSKILKNINKINLRQGKKVNILEHAVILKQNGVLTRIIQEDYEEILPDDKYLFFILKTEANENILFNGKFSKYNLEEVEKDEDTKKKEWKARVLKDYSKELKEK
jgi:hypothetical protein